MFSGQQIPIVKPEQPVNPEQLTARMLECLYTGALKYGNRFSMELQRRLAEELELPDSRQLLVTVSGTAALLLAVVGCAGPAKPGDVALLPAFTFPATAEVLVQLGYRLRFVDVAPDTWTVDPAVVARALTEEDRARLVLSVDTFGNPADYEVLRPLCDDAGVALVADSAAGLGSRHQGLPLAQQAHAHSFSMSFAKVLSAGGAGGAVVLPEETELDPRAGWTRSLLMTELHAIAALDQLPMLEEMVVRRNAIANIYSQGLKALKGLRLQYIRPGNRSSQVHWVMQVEEGRELMEAELQARGIQTKRYYRALHRGPWGPQNGLPVTDALHDQVLALPMFSQLSDSKALQIVEAVRNSLCA